MAAAAQKPKLKTPKQAALDLLDPLLGTDLVLAIGAAFVANDFTSLQSTLPVLLAACACNGQATTLGLGRWVESSAGALKLHQPMFEAACEQGQADVAAHLLQSDAVHVDANALVTVLGVTGTLLQHAVLNDTPDVVRVLLTDASVGSNVNDDGAAGRDDLDRDMRKKLKYQSPNRWTPNWQYQNHNCGDTKGPSGLPPLSIAAKLGRTDCLHALLASKHIDVNAVLKVMDSESILFVGGLNDDDDDDDDEFRTSVSPLGHAAYGGHLQCVRALLAADGIDVNCTVAMSTASPSPLRCAARGGHPPCISALLAADGIDVNFMPKCGELALVEATLAKQLPCVHALLEAGDINVNLRARYGRTALMHACGSDILHRAESYLDYYNQRDPSTKSPSIAAALLATEGIDASLADDIGVTPLYYATLNNMLSTVQLLLQRKEVNANAAHELSGATPLHVACLMNQPGMVRALLLGGGCRCTRATDLPQTKYRYGDFYEMFDGKSTAGDRTPFGMTTNSDVRTLFATGIDYWQRKHHTHHSWAMKQLVWTLLLASHRMDARTGSAQSHARRSDGHTPIQHQPLPLPLLPEEIWLEVLGFLRSADFNV